MANNQSSATAIQPYNKHVKLSHNSRDDDRISMLPEPTLHHILSFLSTKQAATTSVLSKRWRYLWTWVPALSIDQWKAKGIWFQRIIFKIFLSRRAWCVRKFRLSCPLYDPHCDLDIIRSTLCAAAEREVEELVFRINRRENEFFELPTSLLRCKTLVVLKLSFDIMMAIGSSVHFPSLKVLHLVLVWYKDEDTFRSLISACPVLDYLVVLSDGSVTHNGFHYEISSLTVRHIILRKGRIRFRHTPLKITVSAPALEYLTVDYGYAPGALVLNSVSSSVHVNIKIGRLQLRDNYRDTMKDVVGALCNVQFLELKFNKIEVLPDRCIPNNIFPIFDNLVRLKLLGYSFPLPVLLNILRNCSRLQHLTFKSEVRYCPCKTKPQCWNYPQHVPNCLTFHLTTIKFEGFKGLEAEMEFVQYVLKNSKVLKNMAISYRPEMDMKSKFDAILKIPMFEMQATKCQLTFQKEVVDKS